MNVSLFGPLSVCTGERRLAGRDLGGPKPRGLLELLLLARGRVVSKDALADALWGTAPPRNVSSTLEHYVCMLRHRLVDDHELARRIITTEPNAYRFDTAQVSLDIDRFDDLVVRAEHADLPLRRQLLTEAASIADRELLEDAPYVPWAQTERETYRSRVARIHMWLAADALATAEYHVALRHSEEALRFAPYSEQAFRTIMVADLALGHTDLARDTYTRCRVLLHNMLNVDPTTETANIAAAIDAGAPATELIAALGGPSQATTEAPLRRSSGQAPGRRLPLRSTVTFARVRPVCSVLAGDSAVVDIG